MSELPANGFEAIDHPIHKVRDELGITPKGMIKDRWQVRKKLLTRARKRDVDNLDLTRIAKAVNGIDVEIHKLCGDYPAEKLDITDIRMVQIILDALPLDVRGAVKDAIKKKTKK